MLNYHSKQKMFDAATEILNILFLFIHFCFHHAYWNLTEKKCYFHRWEGVNSSCLQNYVQYISMGFVVEERQGERKEKQKERM